MPVQPDPRFLEHGYQQMRRRAELMAPQIDADGAEALTPDEIDTLWNRRHLTLEQEWELHRATKPDGSPMFSPEQIGLLVFKDRERLAKLGGRVEPKDQITWANVQAKRAASRRMADPLPEEG